MHEGFYVIRTYSHTDRQHLVKVMSRPMKSRAEAESWKDFCESESNSKSYKFFIMEVTNERRRAGFSAEVMGCR